MEKCAPAEQDQEKVHNPADRTEEEERAGLPLSSQDARDCSKVESQSHRSIDDTGHGGPGPSEPHDARESGRTCD